jgi:hypothetical protein
VQPLSLGRVIERCPRRVLGRLVRNLGLAVRQQSAQPLLLGCDDGQKLAPRWRVVERLQDGQGSRTRWDLILVVLVTGHRLGPHGGEGVIAGDLRDLDDAPDPGIAIAGGLALVGRAQQPQHRVANREGPAARGRVARVGHIDRSVGWP